jgi:hypothetical protein
MSVKSIGYDLCRKIVDEERDSAWLIGFELFQCGVAVGHLLAYFVRL